VAAVAASASDLAHPRTARANGVAWQTGVVNSDNQTFVEPADGSFPDPTLLTVRVGTAAPFQGLSAANSAAVAAYGTTSNAAGVYATAFGGTAVEASSETGIGVYGASNTGLGVSGESGTGTGVSGNGSTGVTGFGGAGPGVAGISFENYGGRFSLGEAGKAQVWLVPALPSGPGGPPTSNNPHLAGELYVDGAGMFWACTAGGTPGTWIRLSGPHSGVPGGAISYLSTPIRLLDARTSPGTALVTRGPLAGNETYAFTVAGLGGSGIPAGAQGLIGNVTVLGPSGIGNLSLFPAPGPGPSVASMTFGTPGLFLANGVNVGIGTAGQIMIQNQSSGTTPLVLDAVAYVS
jgi:hypothetical protein